MLNDPVVCRTSSPDLLPVTTSPVPSPTCTQPTKTFPVSFKNGPVVVERPVEVPAAPEEAPVEAPVTTLEELPITPPLPEAAPILEVAPAVAAAPVLAAALAPAPASELAQALATARVLPATQALQSEPAAISAPIFSSEPAPTLSVPQPQPLGIQASTPTETQAAAAPAPAVQAQETNPEFQRVWAKAQQNAKPLGDVREARRRLSLRKADYLAANPQTADGIIEEDMTIPARDGYQIPIRVHREVRSRHAGHAPLAVIFHGGGFVLGNLDSETILCRKLVKSLGFVCINVDYRLGPEAPFPCAPHDCFDSTKWAAANASRLGADPHVGFIVGGTSAGATLADVVAHLARDEGLNPRITGLLLLAGAFTGRASPPKKYLEFFKSRDQNKDAAVLSKTAINWMMQHYKPDFSSHLHAPFLHPSGHAGIPPAYMVACGLDPLRDDSVVYDKCLREEHGIPARLKVYPGLPHAFWSFFPGMEASTSFYGEMLEGTLWLLEQSAGSLVKQRMRSETI